MERHNAQGGKMLMCASRSSHIRQFHEPYLRWLFERGWKVDTVSQGRPGMRWTRQELDFSFSKKEISLKNIQTIFKVSKLLRWERYDVVVAHATLAGFLTRLAVVLAKSPKPRLVLVCHGYLFREGGGWKNQVYRLCEKAFSGQVDCLLTMNREDEFLAHRYGLCREIFRIPGMGVCPLPHPKPDEIQRTKQRLGLENTGPVFLCVGEFSRRKNQALLLDAFAQISPHFPGARLLFAGEGELLEACRQQARPLGDCVQFLGQRSDIPLLLSCCDWLVTASRSEGLPFSVMEALALGKPVLASNVKGHQDLIRHGENGRLFPLDDRLALISCWESILRGPDWREKGILPEKYQIHQVLPQVMACYLAGTPWEIGGSGHEENQKEKN